MPTRRTYPQLVTHHPSPVELEVGSWGDVALLATIWTVTIVPLAGELAGGSWGEATLGLAAGGAVLAGRELLSQLRALLRGAHGAAGCLTRSSADA